MLNRRHHNCFDMTEKPVAEQLIFIFQGDFYTFKITNNFARFSYSLGTHFKKLFRNRNMLRFILKSFVLIEKCQISYGLNEKFLATFDFPQRNSVFKTNNQNKRECWENWKKLPKKILNIWMAIFNQLTRSVGTIFQFVWNWI